VTPQVWHGVHTASGENAVVYEVKFNYDYYNYVKSQRLYLDTVKNDRRLNSGSSVIVSLAQPCRDSMGNPIPFPQNINSHANQGPCAVSFPPRYPPTGAVVPPIEIVPPPVPPPANVLPSAVYDVGTCATFNGKYPCPTGAIQTKAAWRRITEAEKSDFHWTPGLYYRVTNGSAHPPQVCIAAGNFGLIGLHIIQKTTNQGHYIFATWEHKSVSTDLYTFAEKPAPSNTRTKSAGAIAPAFPGGIRVKRDHDILKSTQLTNEQYYKLISLINPHSVWLNYQLVGVQYIPVQCWGKDDKPCASDGFDVGREDPTGNGQPFHLANLVIETNWGLQNFQGRPPTVNSGPPVTGFSTSPSGVSVDDHYLPNKSMGFDRSLGNVGHSRKNRGLVFNMGGCMGCHGVAQGLGTDFSFALLLGQKGSHPEGPNQEQDLDPKTVRFGQDLSIQYRTLVSPPVSLGIGAGNTIVAAGAPAEQQWVLINPTESGPLSQVTDLSTVVLQSTTAGNYLLATSEVAHKEPGTTWYRLQLAPAFTGDVAKWSVRKLHGKPGALQKNDSFCLVNKQPVDGKSVYLSRYAFDDVGAATVDRCEEKNSWKFGEPFAPLR